MTTVVRHPAALAARWGRPARVRASTVAPRQAPRGGDDRQNGPMDQRAARNPARCRTRWCGAPAGLALAATVLLPSCALGGAAEEPAGSSAPAALSVTDALEVGATVETEAVGHSGDAADDPAVWVHPDDPAQSVVVATDKQGGLLVYDLTGKELQYLPVGDMNNVDIRPAADGFTVGGRPVVLVVAGNRTTNTLDVFELDPDTRTLRGIGAAPIAPGLEVYGSCLYRSTSGVYAFVNSKEGEVEQWKLADDGAGAVGGQLVRTFRVGSQTEGCVADDELGQLYLGEETKGIWKFGAEPDDGDTGILIAEVSSSGPLVGQVEGLALTYGPKGTGYLLASSQGNSSYAVFRREGGHSYVGTFRITDQGGVDAADETDGIDVSTADLGPSFPSGVFVAQDGKNDDGAQNFKLVPLQDVLPR
jgi:3-phytase